MCHVIDNTDHYAHADSSISHINFLQFEDRHWRFLTLSPFFYTNRLRHSDYRKLLLDAGFDIVRENRTIDQRSLEALKDMSLARSFRTKEADDLATATSVFVAKPRTR